MSFTHTEIQTGTGGNDAGKVVQHIKKRRKERKKENKEKKKRKNLLMRFLPGSLDKKIKNKKIVFWRLAYLLSAQNKCDL